jgi:serine protease
MRTQRRVLAAVAVTLAGALSVPASAVSTAGLTSSHPAATITAVAPRVYLWPSGAPSSPNRNAPRAAKGPQQLAYGGGHDGHGVLTQPAVYLVFWGSQWSKTDPYADYERRFFAGLYGRGDDWSGSQSQYCEGVPTTSVECPRKGAHVGLPARRQALKGVWFDDSQTAVPTDAGLEVGTDGGGNTVAEEAVRAALHFGNTTGARNRNAIYLINEPSHFNSIEFGVAYCAYHSALDSSYGAVAYAAIPYLTDVENPSHAGLSCGQNYVNKGAAGTYDGVSIVAGHEYLEAVTDPWPSTGWVDSHGSETGDKCAWKTSGPGSMDDVRLSTGTFAVQGMWSNLAGNGQGDCVTHQR